MKEHGYNDSEHGALDAVLLAGEVRYIGNQAIRERLAAETRAMAELIDQELAAR